MKVFVERQNRWINVNVQRGTIIHELLAKLNINPVAVVITANREVVTEEYKIKGDEEIAVHSVVSGG